MTTGIDLNETDVEPIVCEACDRAKITKIPSKDPQERGTHVGELFWCDVGQIKPVTIDGNAYYSLIIDDVSRYRVFKAHKTKDEVQQHLCSYMTNVKTRLALDNKTIKTLRIDGGREFGMGLFETFCDTEGVELVNSSPHNQYQNGVPERSIQIVQNSARATVIQMRIPTCFWDYVMEATTHTLNRTGQSTVNHITPQECYDRALGNKEQTSKPDNAHLRIIGSRCTVLIDENHRIKAEKLEARGAKGLFLGYQGTHNYKVWLLEGGRFLVTPHIRVYEETGTTGEKDEPPDPRDVVRSLPPHIQRRLRHRPRKKGVGVHNHDDNVVSDDQTDNETKTVKRKRGRPRKVKPELYVCEAPDEDPEIMTALTQEGADPHPGVHSLNFFDESEDDFHGDPDDRDTVQQIYEQMHVRNMLDNDTYRLFSVDGDGPSLKEAMASPEWDMWLKAIYKEIKENLQRGTFAFKSATEAVKGHLIDAKWVLKKKYTSTGELEKYKARIVARGFTQRKGIDYNETAATTARAVHWRILMALAALMEWYIWQIDFIAAYLNGNLEEQIFMKRFPMLQEYFDTYPDERQRFDFAPEKIIRLMNPLYGLKQAGAAWQKKVRTILDKYGFKPLLSDDAIYLNAKTRDVIASYVDDFLLFGPDKARLKAIADAIAGDVPINDLGAADWYLGVRIVRSSETGDVRLDQEQYIDKALASLGIDNMRAEPTPFVKEHLSHATRYEGKADKQDIFNYASLVGKFNFSSCITRPDTAFATSTWARFMSNPSPKHRECIKRLPRYLKGTSKLSIRYRKLDEKHPHYAYNKLGLFMAVDASFADDPDTAKSTTGYVLFMAGGPVAWASKRQQVVTRCTSEAEYVALGAAATEAASVRIFLEELGLMPKGPITVLEDNNGAKKWAEESAMSRKKRHIRVEHHYIRQEVQEGRIKVKYVESAENPADGFTKPLDKTTHDKFVTNLGLESV
ncbi:hypothetical protein DL769_011380 [Monosporascus sp. CRB-8-3]|nr:hypothetical protein DL769_011380 [Monosporascus sp. CRB-8-3]